MVFGAHLLILAITMTQSSESLSFTTKTPQACCFSRRSIIPTLLIPPITAIIIFSPTQNVYASEGTQNYDQYKYVLQLSADYYIFDLLPLVKDVNEWESVAQLFNSRQGRSGGQPSKIERDFINPMRILGTAFDPETNDALNDAKTNFEIASSKIIKITKGSARDLPIEQPKGAEKDLLKAWDEGRIAINKLFAVLNKEIGKSELVPITSSYPRSEKVYKNYVKKYKQCQNRGGPQLSKAWGGLMTTGYLQDSCGIPPIDEIFYQ